MNLNIAIIGGGWYGCHIASSLLEKGYVVKIFEKNNSIFDEASTNNQNRLHLGFHYPRSFLTREQSRRGFYFFKLYYSDFIRKINLNIYSISKYNSLIDFQTFKQIMKSSNLEFNDITNCNPIILKNIEGSISCQEMLINANKAKNYFLYKLKNVCVLNHKIDEKECQKMKKDFDLILDCSWNKIYDHNEFYFEPSIIFKYENSNKLDLGLTIMDGKLCSLYPLNYDYSTLSDVEHTPIKRCDSISEGYEVIKNFSREKINAVRSKMEEKIIYFYPSFKKNFSNPKPILSIKTKKINNLADHRYSFIKKIDQKIYSIYSGKIDTIFDIEFEVLSLLKSKKK